MAGHPLPHSLPPTITGKRWLVFIILYHTNQRIPLPAKFVSRRFPVLELVEPEPGKEQPADDDDVVDYADGGGEEDTLFIDLGQDQQQHHHHYLHPPHQLQVVEQEEEGEPPDRLPSSTKEQYDQGLCVTSAEDPVHDND